MLQGDHTMTIFIKKYLFAVFLVLSLAAAAVSQAGTTEIINTTLSHLEEGLRALQANELELAQEHMKVAGQSSKNIIGGSYEVTAQRGSRAISIARRLTKEGDIDNAVASLKQAIDVYKSLLSPNKAGGRGGLK